MTIIAASVREPTLGIGTPGLDPARVPQVLRVILVCLSVSSKPLAEAPEGRLRWLNLFDLATGFYCGPDPQMMQTLGSIAEPRGSRVISLRALTDDPVGAMRSDEPVLTDVRTYFEHPSRVVAPGLEPCEATSTRVGGQIDALRGAHPPHVNRDRAVPGVAVVAMRRRACVAFLQARLSWTGDEAFGVWSGIRRPDVAVVDLPLNENARLVIPFGKLGL